jgi:UDP-N-acetylenolpyruvoylglucosamine reductase
LKAVVLEAKRHSLGGFEFLEGIPGSLGGALSMNAGAMGASIFDLVESVRTMDYSGSIEERPPSELELGYRCCPSLWDRVVLGAVLSGDPSDQETIAQTLAAFSDKRWSTQPAAPSAGCIFRNPSSIPAGQLIDELGFKGTRVGGALVSEMHANFIVNTGSATAADFMTLIGLIQERARQERGIELETEVVMIGPQEARTCRAGVQDKKP